MPDTRVRVHWAEGAKKRTLLRGRVGGSQRGSRRGRHAARGAAPLSSPRASSGRLPEGLLEELPQRTSLGSAEDGLDASATPIHGKVRNELATWLNPIQHLACPWAGAQRRCPPAAGGS
ncbi:unnamed protein product [Prorocentrum cordatum]|uniref:Uncharacterized protein n=1 Tax=Prorocentrum cordatum TaxID=2364126 RepID=A0ABN9X7M8_9DINO|nr:unnamed protein product [Polarella glacialis]